jgi:hypothetical protein
VNWHQSVQTNNLGVLIRTIKYRTSFPDLTSASRYLITSNTFLPVYSLQQAQGCNDGNTPFELQGYKGILLAVLSLYLYRCSPTYSDPMRSYENPINTLSLYRTNTTRTGIYKTLTLPNSMAQSGSGNHGSRLQKPLHQAPLISISPAISGPETQHNPQQDNPAVRTDNSTIRVDSMTNRDDHTNTAEREVYMYGGGRII